MSLIDFLFPEQAQAAHLREIAETSRELVRTNEAKEWRDLKDQTERTRLERRVAKLESDVSLLAMTNLLLLRKYIQDTGKSTAGLKQEIAGIDAIDGVVDGGIDVDELRRILQTAAPPTKKDSMAGNGVCPDCGRMIYAAKGWCLYCGFKPA